MSKKTTNEQFWEWMDKCPVSANRDYSDDDGDQIIHVFGFVVPISEKESAQ